MDIINIKSFCAFNNKGHRQESEKTIHRIGENICELHIWKGTCIPFISRIHKEFSQLNKWQITQFKNRQRIWTGISPKKIHKRPISTWKCAQHHQSSGKFESKSQDDITSYLLGRTIKSIPESVEKLEISYIAGGNVKWCSCLGRQSGRSSSN